MPEELNSEEVLEEAESILSGESAIPPAVTAMLDELERLVEESRSQYDTLSDIEAGIIERLKLIVESENALIADTMATIKKLFCLP